ncbi:MAG: 2Fe-2S iron-sulfur cluster-binding protein [Pseudomonadota bacterium]
MPRVTFVPDNLVVDAEPGESLLEAAERCGAPVGSACGGVGACASCHVQVLSGAQSLSRMEETENDTLDMAFDVRPSSRLACQARLGVLGTGDVECLITPESRKAYYAEHPGEEPGRSTGQQPVATQRSRP